MPQGPHLNFFHYLEIDSSLIHLYYSFHSLHSSQPRNHNFASPSDTLPLNFFYRKEQAFKRGKPNRTKQDIVRQGKSYYQGWTRQSNSTENVLRACKRVTDRQDYIGGFH